MLCLRLAVIGVLLTMCNQTCSLHQDLFFWGAFWGSIFAAPGSSIPARPLHLPSCAFLELVWLCLLVFPISFFLSSFLYLPCECWI